MATGTIIQIKRTANIAAPTVSDLAEAELAYSQDASSDGAGAILYIESVNANASPSIHKVGGKYYTDIVDGATANNTPGNLVKRNGSGDFAAGIVTATLYGQANSSTIASTANALTTARNITLGGDLTGNAFFNGSSDITISASIAANSVALGTDTTGNYVGNITSGTGISVTGTAGENANLTVALDVSGVSAGTYGNATSIPAITVDQYGRVTSVSSTSISNLGVNSITGTADQITASASTGNITLSLPNDVTVNNNLTVHGNLFIKGTATTLQTTTVSINDSLVKFGNANPGNSLDLGFFGEYTSGGNVNYSGLYRDHNDGKFRVFEGSSVNPSGNTISTSDSGYTIASLVANLTGGTVSGLTANINVGDGGTGRGTFTSNGILFGNATGALRVTAAGTSGQILRVGTNGTPEFGGVDGGTY